MPDLLSRQPAGEKFFANRGKDSGLLEVDHTLAGEMEQSERILYGEHFVSKESFKFLTALEEELDKEWIEQNLGTGEESIYLDETGDILDLDCSDTKITTLPELPAGLTHLSCSNTTITTLPELPAGLIMLDISSTKITTLPELPAGLIFINCQDTPLAKDQQKRIELEAECLAKGIELTI